MEKAIIIVTKMHITIVSVCLFFTLRNDRLKSYRNLEYTISFKEGMCDIHGFLQILLEVNHLKILMVFILAVIYNGISSVAQVYLHFPMLI